MSPGSQPGEKNTCTAAVITRPWATWMARAAVSARHHQRAAQAVCGSAYRASTDRGGGGQQHHGHQPDHVDRREHQGQHDPGQGQQDQEDPAGADRVAQRGHQRGGGALRVHPAGGERGGQAVGEVDRLRHQDHRQVRGDEPDHDPGRDLLGRVGGLQRLVAHHDDPADEHQQPVAGVRDPEPGRPQGPHRRDGVRLRGRQGGPPDQGQQRVDRRLDQPGEPARDRVADVAAEVQQPAPARPRQRDRLGRRRRGPGRGRRRGRDDLGRQGGAGDRDGCRRAGRRGGRPPGAAAATARTARTARTTTAPARTAARPRPGPRRGRARPGARGSLIRRPGTSARSR